MKRLTVALIIAVMASLFTMAVPQANAATTTDGDAVTGLSPIVPGTNLLKEVKQADKTFAKANKAPKGEVQPNVSVSVGWGTVLLSLSHADVGSVITKFWVGGVGIEFTFLCGLLPGYISTAVCVFAVFALESYVQSLLVDAWNQVSWEADWACDLVPEYNLFGQRVCNMPGSENTIFGYISPVYQSGLNILFTWLGNPIAFEITD